MTAFLDSFLILLREGLEAVLVLAALGAMLRRAAAERAALLGWGALAGVAASLLAALAYWRLLGGEHDDRVEAVTLALAAALLLWTGGWLARRADPRAWQQALERQAERALQARRVALAVGAIGFLAVFREGAETVLFVAALEGAPLAIAGGLGAAALVLAGIWAVIRGGTLRLPLRPLILGTSAFLLLMAARFAAAAVGELQEQQVLGFTPLELPDALLALGLPDSMESLATFAAVLAVALGMLAWRRLPAPAAAQPAE